jgi:MFS transporter, DHA1 family, inner membrane transport protein
MSFFSNQDINRLSLHTALHQAAFGLSLVFFAAFMLRAGLSPSQVFAVIAAILIIRFFVRTAVPSVVQRIGFRNAFIVGSLLFAVEFLVLASYDGSNVRLFSFVVADAMCSALYWTCYHTFYAALGDPEARGAQLGARGLLSTIAAVAAPAVGGGLLVSFGPWASFGAAAVTSLAAVIPLFSIREPIVPTAPPMEAFRAVREGILLFATDGFVTCISAFTWDIISFVSFGERYDVFGGVLALASLAGGLAGLPFGRFIDAGHGTHAVWINAVVFAVLLLLKAACVGSAPAIALATVVANLLGGLYLPVLMTAIYNDGKVAPCTLRFHVMAEAGWDVGGTIACVCAATAWAAGIRPAAILLFALFGLLPQAWLALRRYRVHAIAKAAPMS